MPSSLKKTLNNHCPNDIDKNVLKLLLGEKTCTSNQLVRFWWWVGFAIILTILFYICVNFYCQNPYLIVILFFVLVLGLDSMFIHWREKTPLCGRYI